MRYFKKLFRGLGHIILVSFFVTLLGALGLWLTFLLPTDVMQENVARSSSLFDYEYAESNRRWDYGYESTAKDTWTESMIMEMAIYDGKGSALDNMLKLPYAEFERGVSLTLYANHVNQKYIEQNYSNYWGGIIGIVKILLLFFDCSDIRMINMIIELCLFTLTVASLLRKKISDRIFPFLILIVLVDPVTNAQNIKYACCYIPMLICCLIILNKYEWLMQKHRMFSLFIITGTVVSFFDYCSFPIIAFGGPALCYLWMSSENQSRDKQHIVKIIEYFLGFGIAYSFCWFLKWAATTLLTDFNLLAFMYDHFLGYHTDSDNASLINGLYLSIRETIRWPYILMFVGFLICFIVWSRSIKIICPSRRLELFDYVISYLIIMISPLVMAFFGGEGYSYQHYWMACHQYAVSWAAVFCVFQLIIGYMRTRKVWQRSV